MTTLETPTVVRDLPAGSLLAEQRDILLTFPGVDAGWPGLLVRLTAGRNLWVEDVVERVAEWTRQPAQQATGWFAHDLTEVLSGDCDTNTAAQAPFALAGTTLVSLASVAALESQGLAALWQRRDVRATGHSAGLISAMAAGGGQDAAVSAVQIALALGITATEATLAAGMAGTDPSMAAVTGLTTSELETLLAEFPELEIGMVNGRIRHVVTGAPALLRRFQDHVTAQAEAREIARRQGQAPGRAWDPQWEALPNTVPFHHSALAPAVAAAVEWLAADGIELHPALEVIDPATGGPLASGLSAVAASVLSTRQDWAGTVRAHAGSGSLVLAVGPSPVHAVTEAALRGTGAAVVRTETPGVLFTPRAPKPVARDYAEFAPTVNAGGMVTKHTRLTGRSPFILAGMTPTTVDAGIVAAAANAGHVAELAGGGQVTPTIFQERLDELSDLLEPGHEVVFNALHLDPYLWGMHLGADRLVQKARAAGAPICGVTVSAGIPDTDAAVALLDELNDLGIWLNAFKPGSAAQVRSALDIADRTEHLVWLHVEGGNAGGHHSWEDLESLLLDTYHQIREHDNVVLAVGGGIGTPERAADLLTGRWSERHGVVAMPVDAILVGTAAMATAESTASASVKELLAQTQGVTGWVTRGAFEAGMTSGLSGLNADIHFVDNSASRAAALLDEVAGDETAVQERRTEIIDALSRTAKPYFGDVEHMTYAQLLRRYAELAAVGSGSRYQDGVWLDRTHRTRFQDLLQRAEARLHPNDTGLIESRFSDLESLDDPAVAIKQLLADHPAARVAQLHPADVDYFLVVCRQPGKPVPLVPVIDADVRRWYQSDALWQSHDPHFDADQVLIIPGPTAVAGITEPDEPVAELMSRFERAALGDLPSAPRTTLLESLLAARTVEWGGAMRPNPLRRIGTWQVRDGVATWHSRDESARVAEVAEGVLELTLCWPGLTAADGELGLRIDAVQRARGWQFVVSSESLAEAGRMALNLQPPVPAGDAAHAAAVGSDAILPDATMRRIWPTVFALIGESAPDGMLDLVHMRHRIERAPEAVPALRSQRHRADGYTLTTVAGAGEWISTDDFFVRSPGVPGESSVTPSKEAVDTPHLLLGAVEGRAPRDLTTFAAVSGDLNPIHRSDSLARLVGLPGRIVHGMWTSAFGQRAAVELACAGDVDRLQEWDITFMAPVLPGAELRATATRTGMRSGRRQVEIVIETADEVVAIGTAMVSGPRTAYVFPGQGIQHVGMGMDGYARSQAARDVWDTADAHCRAALGFSILEVVRDNPTSLVAGMPGDARAGVTYRHPAGVLFLTQFTQVAMATLASAQVAEMREAGVFDESAVTAGHSVGEYNALAAVTGTLELGDLLELVFARGTAMHHLVPRTADGESGYRLAVVRPHLAQLSHEQADALVRSVAEDSGELCQIVNHNLRGKQYAVAGTVKALAELERRLGTGRNGKSPFLLVPGIDVPFHSAALLDGVPEFREHLLRCLPDSIDPQRLVGRYVPNLYPVPFAITREYVEAVQATCGSPLLLDLLADWDSHTEGQITRTLLVELLAWQFAMPVRWIETTDVLCAELGVERIVEVGVGAAPTLTNLCKGALALPTHRGTSPQVLNLETDEEVVFEQDATPVTEAAPQDADEPAPVAAPVAQAVSVPDRPVDTATALHSLIAVRAGLRLDELGQDSIESLVDGASSRRNQLLMDIGKEFGVSGMDGAHEVALPELAAGLSAKASGYRYPGPVLAAWLEAELPATLGPLAANAAGVRERVAGHWGLGAGWSERVLLEIALGSRGGTSKRGGDLATLRADSLAALVDEAVHSCAERAGVTVAPATGAGDAPVDAAAVAEVREHFESVLADTATGLLRDLDRLPAQPAPAEPVPGRLSTLDAEHGPDRAQAVAPAFDPKRHVYLASASTWARADVDHLVQGAASGKSRAAVLPLLDQIAAHRDAEPRIAQSLQWYRRRVTGPAKQIVDEALRRTPGGIGTDLSAALPSGPQEFVAAAQSLATADFSGEVALVTGASPGSIAFAAVAHLLRGGATVVVVTSDDSEPRIAKYRDLERRYAGPGAELHIVRANLASFNDVDALLQWLTTSTTETVGTTTTEVKPALWPTLLLPFAAGPAVGSLADTGPANEVTLRLMLLSVQRLIGSLGERIMAAGRAPVRVLLPMSPNHGTFGGDGSYSDTKSALETVMNRWAAEQSAWAAGTRLIALTIGWVRGTGLMAGNDALAHEAEQRLGIHTFSSEEMGALVAAACSPVLTAETPLRLDLSGGLSQAEDISGVLRGVTASATETPAGISALPNLAEEASPGSFDVDPRLPLDDMAVIVSIAELGPWGGSGTRWQAELGELSADAIADLAWRMGLVRWDRERAAWLDSDDQVIAEADLYDAVSETVSQQIGVREFSDTGDVAAEGTPRLAEVYLRKPLTIDGVDYPAGTAIRVPDSQRLKRQVGGQFPRGVDPVRHGLEPSVAAAMDPLAAWNLVVTAEALAAAGISAEELNEQVHPCLIGNVQGTGMGGMNSLHRLYVDPLLGTEHANDLLQEALGNVVSAHVNQSLIGGYGPMVHPVAACATAAVSLEEAVDKIRLGKADVMVAGGWDDLSSEGINGFADMAATADNQELLDRGIPAHAHSRPGDKRRRGFVESQGGGSFLVVRGSVALRLGLPVRAVVAYAGSSGDGIHTSIPAPGLGALGVARGGSDSPLGKALAAHGLEADDIAVVSKHDTSTAANDPNEAMIHDTIQRALGRSPGAPLRVISQKSLTGHAKGGAAAWQLAGLCDVFATGVIPGNRNLVSVDPQVTRGPLVVDYRNLRRAEPVRAALLTSLGFGHVSAVVALAHPAVFLAAVPQAERERYLTASRQREQAGRQHLLGARYGRTPVLQRRTERPDRDAEIDLLIGARA